MDKMTYVNEVVAEMAAHMSHESVDYLKLVMIAKLNGVKFVTETTELSAEVRDNDWAIRRYEVDLIATERSPKTIRMYRSTLRKFFRETGLNYLDVTSQDIIDYIAVLKFKKHISSLYGVTLQKVLRAFYRWAWRHHHVDNDVTRDMESIKAIDKETDRLTDQEVVACRRAILFNAEKQSKPCVLRESALFEMMLSTGLRVGEIEQLNIEDISFADSSISVVGEKNFKKRTVYMSDSCQEAIRAYLNGRTSGALFLARANRRASKYTIERIAKEIGRKGNCHCCTTVHLYRKTFASVLYKKTGDIYLVSRMLGHSSTSVTSKYYLVDDADDIRYKMRKAV